MSFGLTHSGAIARGLAYAPVAPRRSWTEVAAERMAANVTAAKPVQPTGNAAEAREQIRDQIMVERGVDPRALFQMSSQERIRAEAAIMVETAKRALVAQNQQRAEVRATGGFVDLRV